MLETTLVALQDIFLEKVLDEAGRKHLVSEFSNIMQQVSSKFSPYCLLPCEDNNNPTSSSIIQLQYLSILHVNHMVSIHRVLIY